MTDREHDLAAAEVAALRALLAPAGLGEPVAEAQDASDVHDEGQVAAELAAILGAGPAVADPADADADTDDPADAPAPSVAPVVPLRRTARRRWLTAAAGVAAAAVVAVAVTMLPGHDTPAAVASGTPPMLAYPVGPEAVASGEGEPARDTLLALAAAAAEQDAPDPAGDVQHTLSQNYWASTTVDGTESSTTIDPVVSETWVRPDGSSVNLEWRGDPLLADGALEAVSTAPQDAVVDRIPAGTFDADQVADLPREPAALRAALLAPYAHLGCGPDGDPAAGPWCVYFAVTGIADFLVLPPDLEAAIWRVLADEPGLTLAGTVEDRAGHESVAVSVPASPGDVDPTVRMLLVDRSTGRLSGREEITLSSEVMQITEPTVTNFRYTLASDWVAEVGGPPEE